MIFEKVIIKNFKCFSGTFKIDLQEGLNIIVGDNEAGKSTILDAIHLALTGWINGRHISSELSEYLFNKQEVTKYLASLEKDPIEPPSILIEVYFDSDDAAEFIGNGNSLKSNKACGFSFNIEFDENYKDEYKHLVQQDDIKSLPIEYYKYYWKSFARDSSITPRSLPVKSALIDSSNSRYKSGSDIYISRIIRNLLESKEIVDISQAHRKMKDVFRDEDAIQAINKKIKESSDISDKEVELSVELSSRDAWKNTLMTYLDEIPFQHIGKGEQCVIKTKLALSHKKTKEANLILLEEPENHLSHTKLNQLIHDIEAGSEDKQILISTHSSFVANKLGLENLLLLHELSITQLSDLEESTQTFFKKLSGYDTLRLILCDKAILVEGDSDELIVQRAYLDENDKLPIQDGIDVISVGTSFKRFLEIAEKLKKEVSVVTDNDGDIEALKKKYKNYLDKDSKDCINICFDSEIDDGDLTISNKEFNYNTLEPKILKENDVKTLNKVFNTDYDEDGILKYMYNNKTDCALMIFNSDQEISFPQYILNSFKFERDE
ncbi:ATP-dependent nuclease [Fodinibius sp. Rm-B-1B1-1]|uniref:ATP-dependent nuclease n=1 Tax=Fodinibius alkaliphilus TaxID=3140241 RepID=UPI00315B17BC